MKNSLELDISDISTIPAAAKAILEFAAHSKIMLFDASMGAGKTTLIKELCKQLGSVDNFSSPSYSIVNEYFSSAGKIFHFDLYRLKSGDELLDLGIEEYLHSNNYCFFEWPELLREFLEEPYLKIEINVKQNIRYLRASHIM